jgi:molecular chaperone DnaJ
MREEVTHYQILGVPPGATAEQIRKRFLELAQQLHPDVSTTGAAAFTEISASYSVLKNPKQRAEYDAVLKLTRPVCSKCEGAGRIQFTKGFTSREFKTCPKCDGQGYV